MNLRTKSLTILFLICLLLTFLIPALFPKAKLMYFIPFLITAYYQKNLASCLWLSFFCGFIIDLISHQPPFGFYAFNYTITTLLLFNQRRNFFADTLSTLPIMTCLFAILSTLLQLSFLYVFTSHVPINLYFFITDLLIMPLLDGLYAFLAYILIPVSLQRKNKRSAI